MQLTISKKLEAILFPTCFRHQKHQGHQQPPHNAKMNCLQFVYCVEFCVELSIFLTASACGLIPKLPNSSICFSEICERCISSSWGRRVDIRTKKNQKLTIICSECRPRSSSTSLHKRVSGTSTLWSHFHQDYS